VSSRRLFLAGGMAALRPRRAFAQEDPVLADHLRALMVQHRVPAASVALIRNGALAERVTPGADPDTLFQAASISKVVAGQVILHLVDRGDIDLDRPVNDVLRSWKLPGTQAAAVTPRLLLGHRAGTNVPGFPGYMGGAPLPDLRQILDGASPANTPAVRVEWEPGRAFRYSGGGTMVLQQLAIDVARRTFAALAADLVLKPAAMSRSSFAQPLPRSESNAASAHDLEGRPLPGKFHVYPELAAAGLWSSATDLARLALAISASWRDGAMLSRPLARTMAHRLADGPSGLGIFVQPQSGRAPLLYHYGVNAGFRSVLTFVADGSFGLALMTNGEGGRALIPAFCGGIFAANGQGSVPPID
jgi:CubicO group peptidase (beta-lactamase class C family)